MKEEKGTFEKPKSNRTFDDRYYKPEIYFPKKNKICIHPIIARNIKKWEEGKLELENMF
jgi:hypothetical protein